MSETSSSWVGLGDIVAHVSSGSHLGDPETAGEVVRILVDEPPHHGAEIALRGDLDLRIT